LVRQYFWQRSLNLSQIVAQRAGRHFSLARCRLNIDLLERNSDWLDFFVQWAYPIRHGRLLVKPK
jgi:hypothetical protein